MSAVCTSKKARIRHIEKDTVIISLLTKQGLPPAR
jgi:hypothetical protein